MPLFTYKARDAAGKLIQDTLQAASKSDAATILNSHGLQLLSIKNIEKGIGGISFGGGISVSEKANFARFLATMLKSGMSLPESVEIIRQETKNPKMQKVLADVSFQTQKGKSFSAVLSEHKDDFDTVFLTMVRAGEQSGTLEKSLNYLAEQLLAAHELSQNVKGAMMYPAVIVLAMLGNLLMMMIFVLPRIASAFLKLDIELPTYTRIILTAGTYFGDNSLLVVAVVVGSILLFVALVVMKRTRTYFVKFLSKMPVVKNIVLYVDVARFSRTLSTLLKSGVSIVDALEVSSDAMAQPGLKKATKNFSEEVSKGRQLSDILIEKKEVFPSIMVQTIRAGERSGTLETVLEEMAEFYEKEIQFALKRFTSLLEPVLMLAIGVVVGAMVIIMIAPIYSIIGGLQQSIEQ